MLALTNGPQFRYTLAAAGLLPTRRLRYEPVDGNHIGVSLHRDLKSHGMSSEFSDAKLGFVKDGRYYLSRAYAAAGLEAEVLVTIEQLDPNAFAWQPYYQGRVSYAAAEFTATQAKVNLEQPSFWQKFTSRDAVSVDLFGATSVSGAASPALTPLTVQLHSRALVQRYAASQKTAGDLSPGLMSGDENDPSHEQLLYFGFDTADLNELGLGAAGGGFVAGDATSVVSMLPITASGTYSVEFDLRATVTATNNGQGPEFETVEGDCTFRVVRAGVVTDTKLLPDFKQQNLGGDYYQDLRTGVNRFTVELEPGDLLQVYARYFVHDIGGLGTSIRYRSTISATMLPGSYLRITATTRTTPTLAAGVLLYEAFERVAQALSEEVDVFRSDFFGRTDLGYPVDGPGALTLFTGGFQVRGFPLPSAPAPAAGALDPRKSLYTSWQDLFNSAAAAWNLGYGLEWAIGKKGLPIRVLRVEPASYWYPADVVLDITEPVAELKTTVTESLAYQVVEVGYQQWQAEQANGLDEFNSTRQYTTPLTVVSNTYSQLSKVATSGVLLETTRRNRYDATATADTSQDATTFFVCLVREGLLYQTERNQRAVQLTGVLSPETVYNLRLSPARLLGRHAPAFLAGILPLLAAQVRQTSGTGNVGLVSQLVGEPAPVAEGGDVALSALPAPWWKAEHVSFKAPVRRLQLLQLLAKPRGRIRYRDERGRPCEGWVVDFTHAAGEQTGDFTLLPCAS